MTCVALVDTGGANIASLQFALQRLGASVELSRDAKAIASASHVILPGVGAAADGMRRLHDAGLSDCVRSLRQPTLGICLGMQLLADSSEEDDVECLGVYSAPCQRLMPSTGQPVPHMGWNRVVLSPCSPLTRDIDDNSHFYFVHSYALPVTEQTIGRCHYGQAFSAIMQHENFFATQFHPERSSSNGARLLKNFLAIH